ncbi:hypothetical protein RND81_08G177600 [Saponaria officinalis]|uniref:glutathione transferase n=1 Tax=Saponaria officinalis TaxID=3572 RepID=A0AAW1JAA1_SAPOF
MGGVKMSISCTTPPCYNISPNLLFPPLKSKLSFPYKHTNNFLKINPLFLHSTTLHNNINYFTASSSTILSGNVDDDVLPLVLDSASDPPLIFDGTTRLYISYTCPYAQRVWITRNCKGLQDKIKLVPIDLKNRPTWYKEKVYPENKVPSLEHNNEVRGESLDLMKFIDSNFEGPSLLPDDPAKQKFADVLLSYTNSFQKYVTASFKVEGVNAETHAAFDYIEDALSKFDDGPFFLGQFSLVDIAYVPFIERYNPFLLDVKKFDLTEGRPRLAAWIREMNKIEGYKQTQTDPKLLVESYKKRFLTTL